MVLFSFCFRHRLVPSFSKSAPHKPGLFLFGA
uniref:Uncharacterized protein n=1 Tax=Arundo donax TaxID=35708 RepID=A0A0A9BLT4_ARUDO